MYRNTLVGFAITFAALSPLAHGEQQVPNWSDVKGKPTFQAELDKFMASSAEAKLRQPDGTIEVVSLRDMGPKSLAQLRTLVPAGRQWTTPNGAQIGANLLTIGQSEVTLWWNNRLLDVKLGVLNAADRKHVESVALQRVVDRVVKIKTFDSFDQQRGFGTAFYVDSAGWLATNYHVIRGIARVEAEINGNPVKITECVAVDRANDLAILHCEAAKELDPPLRLQDQLPTVGDDIWAVGFPRGLPNSGKGSVGNVLRTADFPQEFRLFLQDLQVQQKRVPFANTTRWVQIQNAAVLPGSSGGPLANLSGEVIGVNTWVAAGQFGQAVHAEHLADLIASGHQQAQRMPLPLAPVDGEPLLEWLHPDVAGTFAQGFKQDPTKINQWVMAARPQLLAMGTKEPKTWKGLQALYLVCQVSRNDPNGNNWIAPASKLILQHYAREPVATDLAIEFCASLPSAAADYCRSLMNHPQADQVARSAASLGLMGNLLFRLEASQGLTTEQLKPLRGEIEAAKSDWKGRFAKEHVEAYPVAGQLQLVHSGRGVASPIFLDKSALEEFTAQQPNAQGAPVELTYGNLANRLDYYLDNLAHGATANNFCGKNLKGGKVCLEGLKGQVVLLDFFADWCGHCVRMYPLERKLHAHYQQRFQGKFTLVGVTADPRPEIDARVQKGDITWPVCFDEPPAGQKPVMDIYRVDSFPMLVLLDKQGVIRYRWDQGLPPNKAQELFNAINKLIRE